MKSKSFLLILSGFCLLIFVFFSYLVHKDFFIRFDFDTTVKLQDKIPPRFDEPFSIFSDIGNFEPMLIFLLLVLLLRRKIWGVVAFGSFGLFHIVEIFGKFFVEHPPPPEFMLRTKHLIEFPQFHVRAEFSYPSGHAGRAVFVTVLLGLMVIRSKKLSQEQKLVIISILGLYDILMFISRVYLGEHWATDVIGGALLGLSLGLVSAIEPQIQKLFSLSLTRSIKKLSKK